MSDLTTVTRIALGLEHKSCESCGNRDPRWGCLPFDRHEFGVGECSHNNYKYWVPRLPGVGDE